jgi:aryl-alcohol dehydrogenase-like predicted oxidoreductase
MSQPAVAAPIVSATNLDQLKDILGSAEVKLTAEDQALLDTASAKEPEAA